VWTAEQLIRDNKWGFWHPYLPFLGDEVTGKTIAIIGTGRIGLALIKKMRRVRHEYPVLRPGLQNHSYVQAIQETNDLRHARGYFPPENLDQVRRSGPGSRVGRLRQCPRPFAREGESPTPTFHLFNEQTLGKMKPTA